VLASAETIDDEDKNTHVDAKSTELVHAADEPSEQKDISIETSNARVSQIDQIKIIAEQDQVSQESDVKPTDQDQVIEDISAEESADVNTTVSASVEKIGEESVDKEESVILHEENVAVEMPEEEAANEKHTEEEANFYLLTLRHELLLMLFEYSSKSILFQSLWIIPNYLKILAWGRN
jgi:hypothetical protein